MAQPSKAKRAVGAPPPSGPTDPLPANRVLSVEVAEDEEVLWTWTSLPGGQRYASGYTIRKKARP
ncbi:MAG: hypothetical protein ABIL09_05580 [Gemmatimonadota bacterium]